MPNPIEWLAYYLLGKDPSPPTAPPVDTIAPLNQGERDNLRWLGTPMEPITTPSKGIDTQLNESVNNWNDYVNSGGTVLGVPLTSDKAKYEPIDATLDAVGSAIDQATPGAFDPGRPVARMVNAATDDAQKAAISAALGTILRSSDRRAVLGTGENAHDVLDMVMMNRGEIPAQSTLTNAHLLLERALATLKNMGLLGTDKSALTSAGVHFDPTVDAIQLATPMNYSGVFTVDPVRRLKNSPLPYDLNLVPPELVSIMDPSEWKARAAIHELGHANDFADFSRAGGPRASNHSQSWIAPGLPRIPEVVNNPETMYNMGLLRQKLHQFAYNQNPPPSVRSSIKYAESLPSELAPTLMGETLAPLDRMGYISTWTTPVYETATKFFNQLTPYVLEYLKSRGINLVS